MPHTFRDSMVWGLVVWSGYHTIQGTGGRCAQVGEDKGRGLAEDEDAATAKDEDAATGENEEATIVEDALAAGCLPRYQQYCFNGICG